MKPETQDFCQNGAPFKAVHRSMTTRTEWVVRDITGYAVAETEDEDAAHAIADVLNDAVKAR